MTNINLVVAVDLNGAIGNSVTNSIPWKLSGDMRSFKAITTGKTIVMGRKTFESLGNKPLPNRRNVVITSDPGFKFKHKDIPSYGSVSEAMKHEETDLYAIGGQRIYEEAMTLLPSDLYITVVNTESTGDVYFPHEGRQFLAPAFIAPNFVLYKRQEELNWVEENGLKYCITKFSREC